MKSFIFITILLFTTAMPVYGEIIYHTRSLYQDIYVRDSGPMRCMQFAASKEHVKHHQGCIYRNSNKMVFSYSEVFLGTLLLHPDPDRILVIGLGIGVAPTALSRLLPDAVIDIVEIDPEVVTVAQQYFDWPANSSRVTTYVADGRIFIKKAAEQGIRYDIVLLDAFNGEYIPDHMMTLDFLNEVISVMKPDGVFASNTFAGSQLYDHESTTYQAAFGDFYNVQMDGKSSNRIIVGSVSVLPGAALIRKNAMRYAEYFWSAHKIDVNNLLVNLETNADWDQDARVLTDQYAPANILTGKGRLNYSWKNTLASKLEYLLDEHPLPAAVGLLSIILAFLLGVVKFFDFLVLARRQQNSPGEI